MPTGALIFMHLYLPFGTVFAIVNSSSGLSLVAFSGTAWDFTIPGFIFLSIFFLTLTVTHFEITFFIR